MSHSRLGALSEVAGALVQAAGSRPDVDYAQAFVEASAEVRREYRSATGAAAGIEVRTGAAVLFRERGRYRFQRAGPEQLAELVGRSESVDLDAAFRLEAPRVTDVRLDEHAADVVREDVVSRAVAVRDSEGVDSQWGDVGRRLRIEASVTHDGGPARGMSRWFGRGEPPELAGLTATARSRAQAAADARAFGSVCSPVVFRPSAGAAFLHELVGHALEADNFNNQQTYIHRVLAANAIPPALRIDDDPGLPDGYGSIPYDDEGRRVFATTILDAGSVAPLTSTRFSCERAGSGPRARRQDFRHPAIPRASNTVVRAGDAERDDLDRPGRTGVLSVGGLGAGRINLFSGEYTFSALDCVYRTPGGDLVPVADAVLVGDARHAIARLVGVGSDMGGDNVTCGKQGQFLGVGLYSPTMRFDELRWVA